MWTGKLMCMLFLPNRVLIGQKTTFQSNSSFLQISVVPLSDLTSCYFCFFPHCLHQAKIKNWRGKDWVWKREIMGMEDASLVPLAGQETQLQKFLLLFALCPVPELYVKVEGEHTGMESTALSWIAHICLIRMIFPLFCFILICVSTLPSLTSIFSLHPSKPALCSTPVS